MGIPTTIDRFLMWEFKKKINFLQKGIGIEGMGKNDRFLMWEFPKNKMFSSERYRRDGNSKKKDRFLM